MGVLEDGMEFGPPLLGKQPEVFLFGDVPPKASLEGGSDLLWDDVLVCIRLVQPLEKCAALDSGVMRPGAVEVPDQQLHPTVSIALG
ncbi:hypothetical protein SAMN00790413_02089 [Deinococcus hopiensis KR-140]|uniref:Uncharacterized protein n=1 Tax=Deinococcus hopiensis KR-140 TaxID=695939 RepID=A0A1W1VK24_9DEIO|nr:hypothetical protein SAMN00790413_02089 [Deinococcus hopiensis KR-140]